MSLERWITRKIFTLPEALLVRLAGGEPFTIEGRTLDPHLQMVAWAGRNKKKLWELRPESAQRAVRKQFFELLGQPLEAGTLTEELKIPSAEGHSLPARLYRPPALDSKAPLLLYMHMGGGVVGHPDICHSFCSILAKESQSLVLSLDYRLAPQHPFPAGLNDAFSAYHWALAHGQDLGAPPQSVAVGGDSMGGTFAAILAQELAKDPDKKPALQLLMYPAMSMRADTASHESFKETFMLNTEMMQWFVKLYLQDHRDLDDLRLSPGLATDLKDLPPALVITAGHDPLVDEGDNYAQRLRCAGVHTLHRRFDSMVHGFSGFINISPGARRACVSIGQQYNQLRLSLLSSSSTPSPSQSKRGI